MKIQNMTIIKEKSKSTPTVSIYCLQIFSRVPSLSREQNPHKNPADTQLFSKMLFGCSGRNTDSIVKKKGKKSKDIINKVSLGSSKGS